MDPTFLKAEELAVRLMTKLTVNEMGAGVKTRVCRQDGQLGYLVTVVRLADGVKESGFVPLESLDWLDKITDRFRRRMAGEVFDEPEDVRVFDIRNRLGQPGHVPDFGDQSGAGSV